MGDIGVSVEILGVILLMRFASVKESTLRLAQAVQVRGGFFRWLANSRSAIPNNIARPP